MVRPKNIDHIRKQALIRARYKCEWTGCKEAQFLKLTMIEKIGTMGRDSTRAYDEDNVAMFCKWHSDIYTGKQQVASRREYIKLVQEYLELKRNKK